MLLWVLRLVLLLVLLRLLWRFLVAVVEGAAPRERRPPSGPVSLARDPVCGTFVVPTRALTAGDGASRQYFCSDRCRSAYLRRAS